VSFLTAAECEGQNSQCIVASVTNKVKMHHVVLNREGETNKSWTDSGQGIMVIDGQGSS
jgi:hypothetical protein